MHASQIAALLILGTAGIATAAPLDAAHSRIGFTLKQMNVPMDGQFRRLSGDVTLDTQKPAGAHADISIAMASVSLPTAQANSEVQKADWFDVARFPSARFVTRAIRPLGGNRFQFSGKLTLKGVTRDVSAPFTVQRQGALNVADGVLPVSRLAYKIGEGDWADTDTVADTVTIRFHIAFPANNK